MKRPFLHFLFWFVYLIQDTLLHFTWMASAVPAVPDSIQFGMAVKTALVLLPVKILLVYYLIRIAVKEIFNEKKSRFLALMQMGIAFAVSVFLFRISFYYMVYPKIYLIPNASSLLSARSIFISILEMGYIAGAAFAIKLLRLQIHAKEREKDLVKEKLETELKFLRNQTNPHFLFNTLNNIYALSRKKSDKTPEVVLKLSELLSFMLYESVKGTIPIDEEIKMWEIYMDLEKIRYNERLSIRFNKNIDNGSQPIAPLLLLPLVENAFKHGVSETRFDSFINIDVSLNKGNLLFRIENTIENDKAKPSNGSIGLNNIRRQLELMYKEHELTVEDQGKVFKVSININLDSYGKI